MLKLFSGRFTVVNSSFCCAQEKAKDIDYVCHLVVVKPVPIEENVSTDETSLELPKMYYKVWKFNVYD